MNLGGLGRFNMPVQSPAAVPRAGASLNTNGVQAPNSTPVSGDGAFQIPETALQIPTQTPVSAALPATILPSDNFLPDLSGQLDQRVEQFLEDMERKTGLGANLLMASLNQSMQKLPDVEAMLKTFSDDVIQGASEEGVAVSRTELQRDFRVFLKDLQNTIAQVAAQEESTPVQTPDQDKKYQFEVLTESQARDKRTQALVEKVQKEFFGVQAARPTMEAPSEFTSRMDMSPRMGVFSAEGSARAQAPGIQTTDQFFQARQQEDQLLSRLRQIQSWPKSIETSLAPVMEVSEKQPQVKLTETSDSLAFEESLLDQIAIAGPILPRESAAVGGDQAAPTSTFESALQPLIPEDAKVENLGEIIQSARMAATNGGGEMELELKPEGLGKVQVKVSVEGDQVQVQMTAENKRVQELLTEGLQDLRSQLAAQKLHSESLRVDGATQNQEADLARRDAAQDQQNRSFAQGFMQQFREEREAARGGMVRFPDPERPSSGRSSEAIKPLSYAPRAHEGRLSLIA
jgi:flagellar hook-length control protein FliK